MNILLSAFQIRLERAAYRNFAAPIVDVFSSFICDNRPERTLPGSLLPMLENVDRNYSSADVFFANMARMAAACGTCFVLVDMEKAIGTTIAESKQYGRRELPYFLEINADDVFVWSCDEKGLVWAVIHSLENVPTEPFTTPLMRDVLTVWTRNDWRRLVSDAREASAYSELTVMSEETAGTHNLGEVPLIPFLFEPVTTMSGNPATDDVLSLILRVYRHDSELDKMLFDCAVPLGIFTGIDPDQKEEFIRATSNILFSSTINGITGQYVEPGNTSYNALRETISNDILSIREIALRMVRPQTAVGESAEAKNIDKQQLDTQLANFARRCAAAEGKCWELAYKWLNNGAGAGENQIITPYNEDYQVHDADKLDRQYLLEMLRNGVISKQGCLELLQKIGVLEKDFDAEEELRRLEMEIKQGPGPVGTNASFLDMVSK